jgi:hypothetical protein
MSSLQMSSSATTGSTPSRRDRSTRHRKHGAGLLVLGDRVGAAVAHGLEPFGAILLHARQDDADGVGARDLRSRVEQHVDRGTKRRTGGESTMSTA